MGLPYEGGTAVTSLPEAAARRVRRPREYDDLLAKLVEEGPFEAMRDALVFAAAVGWWRQRRLPIQQAGEPIRWDVMTGRRGTEALVNLLAVAVHPADLTILSGERFGDRIAIFEEYAHGGLEIINELLRSPKPPVEVFRDLVLEACPSPMSASAPDLRDHAPVL
jgi:dnd system-associated protein 4